MRNFFGQLFQSVSKRKSKKTDKRKNLARQIGFEHLEQRQVMTTGISVTATAFSDYPYTGDYALEPLDAYEEEIDGSFVFDGIGASFTFTIGGDAELGVDYRIEIEPEFENIISIDGNTGTVDLPGNQWTGEIGFNIIVLDDNAFEGMEAVTVTIDSGSIDTGTYHISQGSDTVHILDFEDVPGDDSDPFENITDAPTTCQTCTANPSDPASGSSGSLNPKSNTVGGVSAIDGSARATTDYASSNAFGADFGVSLSWSNNAATLASSFGQGVTNAYQPRLAVSTNDDVLVSIGATKSFFYKDGTDYVPYHSDVSSLTYDSGNHTYTYRNTAGTSFTYYDDASNIITLVDFPTLATDRLRGQVLSITDTFGNVTTYNYDINVSDPAASTGLLLSIERTDGVTSETWEYSYLTSGAHEGLVSTIVQKIDTTDVRTLEFDYYTNNVDSTTFEISSLDGFLKSVTVRDGSVTDDIIDQTFYRYYGDNDADGYMGGLKMLLRTEAIQRATTALSLGFSGLSQASDEDLSNYADLSFKYDGQKRVTELVALGEGCTVCSASGEGAYEYSYDTSANSDGYNSWKRKTVETLPDGTERIYYLNYAGQKMLDITKVGSDEWITYYRYDSQGRLILQANPSAVTDYDEAYAALLDNDGGNLEFLADSAGLISTYSYGASTTASSTTAGNAVGYLSGASIQHGESGTAVPQATYQYYAHESDVDGTFVYPVATQTVYRNDNGTGGQTTTFAYTWREIGGDETNQILSTSVTLPLVSTGQNGSNTTETRITVNDEYGRPVWHKDAAGYISYTEYDEATGAVVKIIRDVNTATTSDFANKPSGWTTPSGGGLHLKTTYEVDTLGRMIKMVDPKGNITYTVYNDAANEVRTYRGWNATNQRPTGPVELSRGELTGSYTHGGNTYSGTFTEYLTYSVFGSLQVDGSGRPVGDEGINDSGSGTGYTYTTTLQTLSRQLSNAGGQLIKSDQYFDFTGTTYTTSTFELSGADTDNFNRTEYGYDKRGRQNRVLDAEGMITRTVFDELGRAVSTWVGTDDTPTSGLFSPSNLTGTNMVQLSAMEYDDGGIGDGNLTKMTQIPGKAWGTSDTPLADRVTTYFYDWRNRTVVVKAGEESTTESTSVNRALSFTIYDNLHQATTQLVFDGDAVEYSTLGYIAGVPNQPSSSLLRAKYTNDYDDQGRIYKSTQFEVDQANGTIGGNTIVTQSFHDIRGLTSKTRDARANDTTYDYDGVGRQTTVTTADPDGAGSGVAIVSQTNYDANGNVTSSVLNPASNNFIAAYTYDTLDRRLTVTQPDPDGAGSLTSPVTTYAYDTAGWLETVTDPLSRVTKTEYDRLGRTVKTTLPDPSTGTITGSSPIYLTSYNGVGNVLTTTDALGNVTTYGYNALHQRTSTTLPDPDDAGALAAPVSYAKYTTGGNLVTTTDAMDRVTTYEYDLLGRQFQVTMPDPDGSGGVDAARMTYTFDTLGGVLTTTDRLSHVASSEYDGFHRLIVSANANAEETNFTYDANGNRLTLTDSNGNETSWVYDTLNRVTSETNELYKTRTFTYDTAGRLKIRTDRRGWTIEYNYDNLSRVTSEVWDTPTTSPVTKYTWTYDAAGQVLTAGNSADLDYNYTYDLLGRATSIEYSTSWSSSSIETLLQYNANGLRTNFELVHDFGGGSYWNDYDNLGRLTYRGNGDWSTYWSYNSASQIATMSRFDVEGLAWAKSFYEYDDAGRLEELRHDDLYANLFAGYAYDWDAANRITDVDFLPSAYDGEDVTYALDDAGQVTGADRAGTGSDDSFSYDDNGNRIGGNTSFGTSQTYGSTAGTNNQQLNDGNYAYTYDDEGNRLTKTLLVSGSPTGERTNYTWDHRNRLIQVDIKTGPTGSLVYSVQFKYDVYGNRIERIEDTNGDTTYEAGTRRAWIYDGSEAVTELSATITERYWIRGQEPGSVLFEATASSSSSAVYLPLTDHLGTVRDVLGEHYVFVEMPTEEDPEYGEYLLDLFTIEHSVYDSFGRVTERWTRPDESSSWTKTYASSGLAASAVVEGYTGQMFEATIGLARHGFRWYDAAVGRWISEDPIGFEGGDVNLGRYVGNASVIYVDPSGLQVAVLPPTYSGPVESDYYYWQAGTSTPPDPSKVPRRVTHTLKDGSIFKWKIVRNEAKLEVDFNATFSPNKEKCPCVHVAFVQIAKPTHDGSPIYARGMGDIQPRYSNSSGYFVDFLYKDKDPYYNAKIDPLHSVIAQGPRGAWMNANGVDKVGNGPTGTDAYMEDSPNYLPGTYKDEFETYAVCIDTGEIYVGLRWGFEISSGAIGWQWTRTFNYIGGTEDDIIKTPSKNFIDALKVYNREAVIDRKSLFPAGGLP